MHWRVLCYSVRVTVRHLELQANPPETVTVWAPAANTVSISMDGRQHAMSKGDRGWWQVSVPGNVHGRDYCFHIDGGDALPDPRSPSQPDGVHGASRFVDHNAFRWTDRSWQPPPLRSGVIYELHIGTFTPEGTFDSTIARLDHLVQLGITHVELMPVAEFAGDRGWGYDGVDLYAPHHAYGGPDGLKRLINACHARGLAVLLDVVYNHLGPEGNYLSQFGPYFTDLHHTPWGQALNLDGEGSSEVRQFLIGNALMWLRDYHFDGLRLDAVHALFDTSAIHFLEELARQVDKLEIELGRTLVLIAESDLNDPRVIQRWEAGGYGLTAQWSDDFHHAVHACLTGENQGYYSDFGDIAQIRKALNEAFVYDGNYSAYRRRHHGRPAAGMPGHRFVICLQNHDQIGNRARGDRFTHLMTPEALLAAAILLLTAPQVPLIFQGEEWGAASPFQYFSSHQDPALGEAVTQGRKREFASFGWNQDDIPDPQSRATFEASKLDWSELDRQPFRSVLDWYQSLIRLRRGMPDLINGEPGTVTTENDMTIRIDRGRVSAVCDLNRERACADVLVDGQLRLTSRTLEEEPGIVLRPVA